MTINILVFGTQNFNNSLDEIKEDLGFSFTYFNQEKTKDPIDESISGVVVDSQICVDQNILLIINKIFNKPILLLESHSFTSQCKYDDKNLLPINFSELESKIKNLIIAFKFNKNSSVEIKNFILDKNEKKLKKRNKFIVITEREVQLIELLFNEKKPLSKNSILKKLWKYADDADTHTVETHIYRLRKKINDTFQDKNFIKSYDAGYRI